MRYHRFARQWRLHRHRFILCASVLSQAGGWVSAATMIPVTVTINGCVVFANDVAVFSTVTIVRGKLATTAGDATIAPAIAIVVATTFVILFCIETSLSSCSDPPGKVSWATPLQSVAHVLA